MGGIAIEDLVDKLRAAVGLEPLGSEDATPTVSYFSAEPAWFSTSNIVKSIDESTTSRDEMPIVAVLQEASHLQAGQILELITTFLPAPGIDIMKTKGLRVWSFKEGPELVRTYISRSG